MGFEIENGPDIDSSYINFTSLNMGPNHSARSMHDSFYVDINDDVYSAKPSRTL